jgi:hypothetical protein
MALAIGVGCSGAGEAPDGAGSAGGPGGTARETTTTIDPDAVVWAPMDVDTTADPLVLRLRLDGLPEEGEPPPCAAEVSATATADPSPSVTIAVSGGGTDRDTAFSSCVNRERIVSLHLETELEEGATVRVAAEPLEYVYLLQADGTLASCASVGCDPATGKLLDELTPGCETLHLDVFNYEVPRYTGVEVLGCEGDWGIVELDFGAITCPGSGERSYEECPGIHVARNFYRLDDDDGLWRPIAHAVGPGCDEVLAVEPDFPSGLCEGLPAP